ncbi:MAG TPA: hypothetical protein VHC72_21120 [Bryobacteraceae bacterium]|nr:hypothetical protein [Bryobacteraceae bacterium]
MKIELIVGDAELERVVGVITEAARSGKIGTARFLCGDRGGDSDPERGSGEDGVVTRVFRVACVERKLDGRAEAPPHVARFILVVAPPAMLAQRIDGN